MWHIWLNFLEKKVCRSFHELPSNQFTYFFPFSWFIFHFFLLLEASSSFEYGICKFNRGLKGRSWSRVDERLFVKQKYTSQASSIKKFTLTNMYPTKKNKKQKKREKLHETWIGVKWFRMKTNHRQIMTKCFSWEL